MTQFDGQKNLVIAPGSVWADLYSGVPVALPFTYGNVQPDVASAEDETTPSGYLEIPYPTRRLEPECVGWPTTSLWKQNAQSSFIETVRQYDPEFLADATRACMARMCGRKPSALTPTGDESYLGITKKNHLDISGLSHFGGENLQPNEDAWAVVFAPNGMRYHIIADGVGGTEESQLASQTYVSTIAHALKNGVKIADAVKTAQKLLHDRLRLLRLPLSGSVSPKTTLTIAEYWKDAVSGENCVHYYYVGNSRAVVFERRKARLQECFRTEDHSLPQRTRAATTLLLSPPKNGISSRGMKKFLDAQWQIICTQAEKIIQKYEDDENKVQEMKQALSWLNGKRSLLTGRLVRHEHDAHMWTQLYEMGQGG